MFKVERCVSLQYQFPSVVFQFLFLQHVRPVLRLVNVEVSALKMFFVCEGSIFEPFPTHVFSIISRFQSANGSILLGGSKLFFLILVAVNNWGKI